MVPLFWFMCAFWGCDLDCGVEGGERGWCGAEELRARRLEVGDRCARSLSRRLVCVIH
jgi:hypothetical protein